MPTSRTSSSAERASQAQCGWFSATCAGLDGGREVGCKNAWVDIVKKQ
jgi:hypothetical protein